MPQNLGVIIRTAACLEFPLHIIKPLPFSMTDKRFKGAVMDYIDHCEIVNHENWENFYLYSKKNNNRIILATTKTTITFTSLSLKIMILFYLEKKQQVCQKQFIILSITK
jgi:tRNA (cytidine/uridine-2'-O-)-methyltransferase